MAQLVSLGFPGPYLQPVKNSQKLQTKMQQYIKLVEIGQKCPPVIQSTNNNRRYISVLSPSLPSAVLLNAVFVITSSVVFSPTRFWQKLDPGLHKLLKVLRRFHFHWCKQQVCLGPLTSALGIS